MTYFSRIYTRKHTGIYIGESRGASVNNRKREMRKDKKTPFGG